MITDMKELKALRENNEITQKELAQVLGWHESAVSRLESGKHDCNVSTILMYQKGIDGIKKSRIFKNTGLMVLDETAFKNTAYAAIIQECESLEQSSKYKGNGHHLAQRLVDMLVIKFTGTAAGTS